MSLWDFLLGEICCTFAAREIVFCLKDESEVSIITVHV